MTEVQEDVDALVAEYIVMRDEKARIEQEAEAEIDKINGAMRELEARLLAVCNSINSDSLRTSHGTVTRGVKERFTCGDWHNFRQFEHANPDYDFRERRVHQGNMKEYLSTHPDSGLPPGVNVMREYGVTVRRAS